MAERLLNDVLDLGGNANEAGACHFEHCLSMEVADSICTLLSHPTTCPHGKAIPPGKCCQQAGRGVRPLVVPLADLNCGAWARIRYIATQHHQRLDRLASMGVLPGAEVRLHQRQPSYVVQLGETMLAIDKAIARDIFVREIEKE